MNIRLTEDLVITYIQRHVKFQKSIVNHSIDTSGQKVLLYLTDTANNITKARIISESIFHTFCHFCLSTMRIIVFGGNLYNKEA